ncbi:tRNA pseudouridine(55) synthase TruB [Aestuariivirga sp. YIM B02566]|uniref:tRNA pseudouridine(55) synthase TruB n=1 Tax=Taklimakanibacter albus TaxID=2800327 RepID=A0ACC5R6T0_9HYPH|nr:tRNA pseudouridine(55) synthase TruB [Aestuariivirga sp. YIM B02566]
MSKRQNIHGWIALDKPEGMGSTQALAKVKWLFNAAKAGHGGTLDPLASGLLPIALGEATKTVSWAMDGRKTYRVLVQWGEARTTDDREGEVSGQSDRRPTESDIAAILGRFEGEILQTPPKFSAIKIQGERAYDLARAGEEVALAARPVHIEKIALLAQPDADHAEFSVTCGKGTYIRSLARDMAEALGTLGHVAALRRTAVGPFTENDMISLEKLTELSHKAAGDNAMEGVLRPIETVLDGIPALAVKDAEAQRLRQGQSVLLRGASAPIAQDAVLVMWGQRPLGICSIEKGSLKPKRLFNL